MSSTAVDAAFSPVRRHLSERQADTVARLLDAAVEEVAAVGYDRLTVRGVARRAGVAAATAYTYFAGKEHLLAEVFLRRLQSLPAAPPQARPARRGAVPDRVAEAVGALALLVADEPELSAGVTTAMLAHDPDVKRIRDAIGAIFVEHLEQALGPDADPAVLRSLVVTFAGAMLMAGMGNLRYDELPALMADSTRLMTRRQPR